MSSKPKFLHRPREIGEWFAALDKEIKFGKRDEIEDVISRINS